MLEHGFSLPEMNVLFPQTRRDRRVRRLCVLIVIVVAIALSLAA